MTNWIKKILLFFLVIASGIFLLFLVVNWHLERLKKTLPQPLFRELETIPIEEIQKKFFGETTEYKEFISPDGKLKIKYLGDWMEIDKEIFETFNQEMIRKGAKILFFAQKFKVRKGAFAFLIIQELEKERWKNLDEIIEETKKEIKEKGGEMEVVKVNEREGILEAKYKRLNQPEIYSLEKILNGEKKIYLIIFLTFKKDWEEFFDEANSIFNSAQLIQ